MEQPAREYLTAKEAAVKWGITDRMVRKLAKAGRVEGAVLGRDLRGPFWLIPVNAKKP